MICVIIHSNELFIFVFDHLLCLPWWNFLFGSWLPLQFITNDDWHKVKSTVVNVFIPLVSTKFLCLSCGRQRDFEDKCQNSCIMNFHFCFLYIFPNADWETLTETWWQTWTWWEVLWFMFWCRRGTFWPFNILTVAQVFL